MKYDALGESNKLLQNNGEVKMRTNQRFPLRTTKREEWSILSKN